MTGSERRNGPFFIAMFVWLAIAVALGVSGRVAQMKPPLPQLIIVGLALGLIFFGVIHRGFREWLTGVDLRGFVAFHLTRFVGLAFLIMYERGVLTGEFAITAGWGDIIAALGAVVLVLMPRNPMAHRSSLFAWNAFGMFDILLVVGTATRIALRSPEELLPLLQFPMSLVPTFVVPIIIASHVLIFWRLAKT